MSEDFSLRELLGVLTATSAIQRAQNDFIYRTVEYLRSRGVGWDEIAEALGVTRQAASEKHRREQERQQERQQP